MAVGEMSPEVEVKHDDISQVFMNLEKKGNSFPAANASGGNHPARLVSSQAQDKEAGLLPQGCGRTLSRR